MNKDRKFFQNELRKDVDIKKHIASEMNKEMKTFTQQIETFAKKVAMEVRENEK